MEKGEDVADDLKDKFDGLLENITDQYETVKLKAEALMNCEKTKLDELEKKAKEAIV